MPSRVLLVLVAVLLLFSTSGCIIGFAGIRGSGNVVTLEEHFDNFDSLRVGHGCRLTLRQGNSFRVVIRIDDNLQEFLEVEQKGSRLEIGMQSGRSYQRIHFEADIEMPDLREVRLSGGSRGQLDRFTLDHDLSLGLSGGSRLEGIVQADHLKVGTSGGAQAELRGSSRSLELDGSGGSQLLFEDLETGSVSVDLSGGSRSTINLNGRLTGHLSGGSNVRYVGDPSEIQVSKSGGARVSRM